MTRYTNVLLNPRFESATLSLENDSGSAVARTNVAEGDMPVSGDYFGTITASGTGEARARVRGVERGAAAPGERWWFRARIRAKASNAAARDVSVGVRSYDAVPGATLGSTVATVYSSPVSLAPGAAAEVYVSAVMGATTQSVAGIIRREATGATGDVIQVDNIVLVHSDDIVAPPFGVPGSETGWYFVGVDDASTSYYPVQDPEVDALTDDDPAPRSSIYFPDLRPDARYITVTRYTDDDVPQIVRGARLEPMLGSFVVIDVEVPLNRAATYRAELFDEAGDTLGLTGSASVTVPVTDPLGVLIADPLDPKTFVRGTIDDQFASVVRKTREAGYADTGGAAASTLLPGGRKGLTDLPLGFYTTTLAATRAFRAIRDQTPIAVLRVANPDLPIPGTLYVALLDPAEVRIDADYTHWEWTSRQVRSPEAGIVVPLRTYADYMAFFETYAEAMAVFTTYVDAILNPPPPAEA